MSPPRDVSTSALLRLLGTGDPEQQCGAALVLGALTPTDRRIIPALGRALEACSSAVRPYVLDALGRFDDQRTFRYIAPYLFAEGSLREQAVRIMQERGIAVLPDLVKFFGKSDRTDTAAFFRAIASAIQHDDAIDFIIDELSHSAFEQARNIAHGLKRAGPRYPAKLRKSLVSKMVSTLDALADDASNPTAEIAIVKILAAVNDARAIRPLLERLDAEVLPALRQNALETLAEMVIPKARVKTMTRRLLPLLNDDEPPSIVAGAMRVLRRSDPFPLSKEEIAALSRSRHTDVARAALRELVRFPDSDSVALLLDALRRDASSVQATAAATLGDMTDAIDAVVAAHEDPRFREHQEILRAILAAQAEDLDGAAFRRRVKKLVDEDVPESILLGRVLALASINRAGLNRAIENRVAKALSSDDPPRAITLLEPLVKNRLATPQGRYLLALGHLAVTPDTLEPGDPHHDRAMQLLSPLARVTGFRLDRQLVAESRIPDTALQAIADHMSRRAEAEKTISAALMTRLRDDG